MHKTHFRFSPSILQRLGEELAPNIDQGLIELVKNAYDADASYCKISLEGVDKPGGSITLEDDGVGMAVKSIDYGWLLLGESGKRTKNRTPWGRIPAGDKGLGRLAALRLGKRIILKTRPKSEPGKEYGIELDWEAFTKADAVEDVTLYISTNGTTLSHGTTIQILDLSKPIVEREVERLARSLILLSDPFTGNSSFAAELVTSDFSAMQKRIQSAYFEDAIARIEAKIDTVGSASAILYGSDGKAMAHGVHEIIKLPPKGSSVSPPYGIKNITFNLWMFTRSGNKALTPSSVTNKQRNEWLDVVGGVHVYQNDLRVPPYGDPGNDWVEMNVFRLQNPEERPSTNNSIGRISLPASETNFIQKTDRTGFIENEQYHQLWSFARDVIRWGANRRLEQAEKRRETKRSEEEVEARVAARQMRAALTSLPAAVRAPVEEAFNSYVVTTRRQQSDLIDELQLYRTLATVGTTMAVFIHDSAQPALAISGYANEIIEAAREGTLFPEDDIVAPAEHIVHISESLQTYSGLPLRLLRSSKRQSGPVDVHEALTEVDKMFTPIFQDANIDHKLIFANGKPIVRGTVAAIEAIFANLLVNAEYAVIHGANSLSSRMIITETELTAKTVIIRVSDNGGGITGIALDDIWLPGRTTKDDGVGLGLKIVKDVVTSLGGTPRVVAVGPFGGAQFEITLPMEE